MEETGDDGDLGDMVDYSELTSEEVHGKLIWFWFRFFRRNENFEEYCDARRRSDGAIRKRLEEQFPKIEELYKDWGDIHILPNMYHDDLSEWKEWLASKRWLFYTAPIKLVEPPTAIAQKGTLFLSVPDGATKKSLKRLLNEFIDTNPGIIGDGPKYVPRKFQGQNEVKTLERLHQAELVYDLMSGKDEFKYSHAQIVMLVFKIPFLQTMGFGWSLSDTDKALLGKGISPSADVKNRERTLINAEKFFENSVRETILGSFPARL